MIQSILAKKLGMSRMFGPDGVIIPVTVLEAGPCTVIQRKTEKTDGYEAAQLAFVARKEKRVAKPQQVHMNKAGKGTFQFLREVPLGSEDEVASGDEITVEMFKAGDVIDVIGRTKGRGFQGVVKRHKFHAGKETHGCTSHRVPGSIGASADPSRVVKGRRLPGQMGNVRQTTRNLKVVDVRPESNLLLVRGAVPGAINGLVIIRRAR
jgi:large subunit ribosomal protein L3